MVRATAVVIVALGFFATLPQASCGLIETGRRLLQASSRCRIDNCGKITCRPYGMDPVCDGPKTSRLPPAPPAPSAPQWPPAPAAPQWPPAPEAPSSPAHFGGQPEAGCFGELPFGLEFCVCDGAEIGEAAGLAACTAIKSTCNSFVAFTSLQEVQQICDEHAIDACRSASLNAIQNQPECKKLYLEGGSSCSAQQAQELFDATVNRSCEPLCPDCERKQETDFPGTPEQLPTKPSKPDRSLSCTDQQEFDLQFCVCEGDDVGRKVGESACQTVKRECPRTSMLASFSSVPKMHVLPTQEELIAVKQVCAELEQQACIRTAGDIVGFDAECADILSRGSEGQFTYTCTVDEATRWFNDAIEFGCKPASAGFP